jgi:hypothetical protein
MTKTIATLIKEDIQKIEEAGILAQLGAKMGSAIGSQNASGAANRHNIENELTDKWKRYISGSGDEPTLTNLIKFMTKHVGFNWKNTNSIFKKIDVDINDLVNNKSSNQSTDTTNQTTNSNQKTKPTESIMLEADITPDTVLDRNFISKFFDQTARYIISNNMLDGGRHSSHDDRDIDSDSDNDSSNTNTSSNNTQGVPKLDGKIDRERMTKIARIFGIGSTAISKLERDIYDLTSKIDITTPKGGDDLKTNVGKYISDPSSAKILAGIGLSYLMSNGKNK